MPCAERSRSGRKVAARLRQKSSIGLSHIIRAHRPALHARLRPHTIECLVTMTSPQPNFSHATKGPYPFLYLKSLYWKSKQPSKNYSLASPVPSPRSGPWASDLPLPSPMVQCRLSITPRPGMTRKLRMNRMKSISSIAEQVNSSLTEIPIRSGLVIVFLWRLMLSIGSRISPAILEHGWYSGDRRVAKGTKVPDSPIAG